jgi:tetratricopeptide (TPR) repeat protein
VGSALAKRVDISPQTYAQRLAEGREKLDAVDASLGLSYGLLDESLQKFFRTLSVFPDTFDAPAAGVVCGLDPDKAQAALGDLLAYSLLDWSAELERYRLHDLVRQFARGKLTAKEHAAAARRHAAYYMGVLAAAEDFFLKGGEAIKPGLALYDLETPNIKAGQAWAAQHAANDDEAARLCSGYPGAGAYCLALRQHPRERIEWLKAALAAARRLHDRGAEGAHSGNLGVAYKNMGETRRAIEYYEQHLAIARAIGDRRGEGNAVGNLGNAYLLLGEPRRAIEYYEQALVIDREIGDRRGEGNALWNMSLVLDKLGERDQAIARATAALEIYEQIEDPNAEKVRKQLEEWGKAG